MTQAGLQTGHYRVMLLRLLPQDGQQAGYPMAEYKMGDQGRIYKVFGLAYQVSLSRQYFC